MKSVIARPDPKPAPFYPYAQPVLITGSAISNNSPLEKGGEGGYVPVPYVPVKIGISIKGFDRYFTVTTDATGAFTYTFTPGSNEAGLYTLWAVHPDIKDRAVQATFAIAGLSMSPETATVRMARGRTIDIPLTLYNYYNYGGGSLTGLTFETTSGNGITANVINPSNPSFPLVGNPSLILPAGQTLNLILRITSSSTAPDTSYATMKAKVNEGLSKTLNANISIVQLIPVITTSPSYIDTGMVRGNQKIATFTITNAGEETLRNARIEGPSTSWMTLTINKALGDIQPGVSKTIGIMFSPPTTLSQGVYDDTVVIYSDNHIPYTYHIQVTVTSNAVGNVLFDVLNELMEDVPNATITLQHQTIPELIYVLKTGADGTAVQYDIPEGRYSFTISPPSGNLPYSGSFVVNPGMTTTIPIALEMNLVTISWSVTPTVIQDKYEIVITQTFETNVPTPVLVIEPPSINLPRMQPGAVFNGEFTISNYGLVAADYKGMQFPSAIGEYDIEVLATIPPSLKAQQKITVPYRITRRQKTASLDSSTITPYARLLDEVRGYGGGVVSGCSGVIIINADFEYIICPNSASARIAYKSIGYTIIYNYCGEDSSGSNDGSTNNGVMPGSTLPGGGTSSYEEYLRKQLGGGTGVPGNYTALTTLNTGGCKESGGGGDTGGGGGATEDSRCSSGLSIPVGISAFNNSVTVPAVGSNTVAISSPANGTGTNRSRVIVKGAIDPLLAGEQMMIETSRPGVDGVDSNFLAHINGNYFAALAPLMNGPNNIKAIAKDLNGVQRDTTVTVNATTGTDPLLLTYLTPNVGLPALNSKGLMTFDVTLKAIPNISNPVVKYSWDFNGDGVTDLECNSLSTVTASFQGKGLYLPSVTITDTKGNKYTDTTIVNVLDQDNMGGIFKYIWKRMTTALMAGNFEGALNDHLENSKDKYRYVFTKFTSNEINTIFSTVVDFKLYSFYDKVAECGAIREEDGERYSFPVTFVKDENGVWKIMGY